MQHPHPARVRSFVRCCVALRGCRGVSRTRPQLCFLLRGFVCCAFPPLFRGGSLTLLLLLRRRRRLLLLLLFCGKCTRNNVPCACDHHHHHHHQRENQQTYYFARSELRYFVDLEQGSSFMAKLTKPSERRRMTNLCGVGVGGAQEAILLLLLFWWWWW